MTPPRKRPKAVADSGGSTERWALKAKDGRTVIVRRATEADAAPLLANINEIGAEGDWILTETVPWDLVREKAWIRGFDGRTSVLYVVEVDGRVVGQVDGRISAYAKARHVAILGIVVLKAYRGLGIGRMLIDRIVAWMQERDVEKATLEVFSTNERAIALYRRFGFEEEGRRRGQFKIRGAYVDDVLMARWLRGGPPPRNQA